MKRKLRKSLSWLLTFAMVISLFCGMIPTASAADDGPEVTGNGAYNGLDTNWVYFHIGTTDIYKMAMLKDPSVTAETDIDSVKINFKNSGSSRQLASSNPADKKTDFAYWHNARGVQASNAEPSDLESVEISYDDKTVVLNANELRLIGDHPGSNATGLYHIQARTNDCYVVAFYDAGDTSTGDQGVFSLYHVALVDSGSTVTDWPEDPKYITYTFGNWSTEKEGGTHFTEYTTVNADTEVFAQKLSGVDVHAGTRIRIMNENDAILARYVELYNAKNHTSITISDIDPESVKITVHGENGSTNPNYYESPVIHNGWEDGYYLVFNRNVEVIDPDSPLHNTHVPFSEVQSIEISASLKGSTDTQSFTVNKGPTCGDFSTVIDQNDMYWNFTINPAPSAPSDDDLTIDPGTPGDTGLLGTNAVKVTCTNEAATHENEKTYGLLSGTYTVPTDEDVYWANDEKGNGAYYVKITDINPSEYVKKYNDVTPGHTLSDEEKTGTITLKLVNNQWTVDSGAPVEFEVTCENEGGDTDHTITVSVTNGTATAEGLNGGIATTSGTITVTDQDEVTITFAANEGYALNTVTVNGQSAQLSTDESGNTIYTFSSVTDNQFITVVYAEDVKGELDEDGNDTGDGIPDYREVFIKYESEDENLGTVMPQIQTVTLDLDENGQPVIEDIYLTGEAIAKGGASFSYWMLGDVTASYNADLEEARYYLDSYTAGQTYTFTAYFMDEDIGKPEGPETFEIYVEVVNGTATFNGVEVTSYILAANGEDITITFTPNEGCILESAWINNDTLLIPEDGVYTLESVDQDYNIRVVYAEPEPGPAGPFYLTYNANGGNWRNVPVDTRAYYQGGTAYLENDTDELDDQLGHRGDDVVFVGWSRNDQYSMNNPATREPSTITSVTFVNSDITVYAVWAEDDNSNGIPDYDEEVPEQPEDPDDEEEDENTSDPTYAVYYYPGYGSGARDLDKRYEEDTEVEVLAFEDVDLTDREGYIFIGWSTQANADSVIYLPGDTFDMPDHDVYLYAQWIREQIGPEDTGVANWLNTTDHIAYLTGYPGGTFGPNNSMTRAEVAQMFYALLNNKNVTITATFPDVPADAWYATAVNTLASLGMVSGDADGNFRPNDPITRAEFCVIALAFAYEPESYSCSFTDVSVNDWFYTYVAQAASYGWIGGYADGSFGPNDLITRAQVTTIVNNMLGREADRSYVNNHADTLVQFNDLTRIHWAYYDIMEAVNEHEYTRTYGVEDWVE